MGRSEAAIACLRRGIALDPLSPHVNVDAGWVLLQAHRFDEAIIQAKRSLELERGMREAESCIARAHQYQAKPEARLLEYYRSSGPYNQAVAFALLNQKEEAVHALDAAVQVRALPLPLMKTEPAFTALYGDARFQELLRKVGLE